MIDDVLEALDRVVQRGDHWEARCPAHEDKVASLSITLGAEDRVLLKDHAGCTVDEILKALELEWTDLYPDVHEVTLEPASVNKRIVATYDYTDEAGVLLFQVVRYEPKTFRQRRPDEHGGWAWELSGVIRVPYRLPELLEAVRQDRWILIVEGEKDVDQLYNLGFAATTSAGGAQSWAPEFAKYLTGARVAILPDHDAPGREYGRGVAESLTGVAGDMRVIALPVGDKGDVTDWLAAGGTADALKVLIRAAAGTTRQGLLRQWREANGGARVVWAADVEPERVKWLWPGRLPFGKLSIIDGDPGESKSTLTLALAAYATTGTPMPMSGLSGRQEPLTVVLLSGEDGMADTVVPRLLAHGADVTRVANLCSIDLPGEPSRPWELPGDIAHLADLIEETGARMVVIDPLMSFLAAGVKSGIDHDVRRALHPLAMTAERTGAAIVVVRHLNKGSGNAISRGGGSMGIIGAARSGLLIAHDPNDETLKRRVVASTKNNLMEMPQSVQYHLEYNPEHDCAVVVWDGFSYHTAETLLVRVDPDDVAEVGRCGELLKEMLVDRSVPVPKILKHLHALAISDGTIAKARRMLNLYESTTDEGVMWGLR
jgi:hypothetical protein